MSNNTNKKVAVVPEYKEKEVREEKKMGDTLYIGDGAAGNKAVARAIERGDVSIHDVLLINSTTKDFPTGFTGKTIILSDDDGGCAKERATSYQYMSAAIQSGIIDTAVKPYTNVVIVTSTEGGTGSGSAPLLGNYILNVLGKNVRIYGFAGFEDDPRGLQNTVEFFQELNFECAVHCIRNSLFKASNKFAAEKAANEEFCNHIRVLSGQDMIASSQNMDNTELDKVRNTVGYCIVDKFEFDDTLMEVDDFNKICKQMIVQSKSLNSDHGQLRFGVILNIKPESEDAIDYNFTVLKEAYGNPYETFMHKQYDGDRQYIAFIATGMKMPLDEIKKTYARYQEESAMVNKERDNFFDEIENMKRVAEDNRFDVGLSGNRKPTKSREDFLKTLGGNIQRK